MSPTDSRDTLSVDKQTEISDFRKYFSGFDEFMNVVFDEAEEVNMKTKAHNKIGRILLKGDNITLIHAAQQEE